ncbi:unnamed protein product, partial [Vitis vinifera]
MPSPLSPQWHEKAGDFFSTSGVKLKEAGQSAGTLWERLRRMEKATFFMW